ncbi:MAG: septum formation inhibitor Maf [Xanthomonadales bacterium]|nr:septum formation inhibitor Maf [Xanthomonadales bacterium]
MTIPTLLLASASPRRAELLRTAGFRFETSPVDLIEQPQAGESALDYGRRIALEKAQAAYDQLAPASATVVLGADTEVVLGRRIYGKPENAEQAAEMLRSLSGRRHRVISAVALVGATRTLVIDSQTQVVFRPLNTAEIDAYVATGEPFGKAGAYALQGRACAFVQSLRGSYTGVVGLPIYPCCEALAEFGIVPDWRRVANMATAPV